MYKQLNKKEIEDLMWMENHKQHALKNKILRRVKDNETKQLVEELHFEYNRCEAILLSELKIRIDESQK